MALTKPGLLITDELVGLAATKSALSALDTGALTNGDVVYMAGYSAAGDGGDGLFRWDTSNLSAKVTNDSLGVVYVPPDSDATGASGAFVRQYSGAVNVLWGGADDSGGTDAQAAFQGVIDFIEAEFGAGHVYAPAGRYLINSTITVLKSGIVISGDGHGSRESSNPDHATVLEWNGAGTPLLNFGDGGTTTLFGCGAKDIALDGQDVASSIGIRLNDKCSNFDFERVLVYDFATCWYGGESCFANSYYRCIAYGFLTYGWRLTDKNNNTNFFHCKGWGSSTKTPTNTVRIGETTSCNDINFYGCDFETWNVTVQVKVDDADGVAFYGGYMEAKDSDTDAQIQLGTTTAGEIVSGFVISGVRMIGNAAGADAIRLTRVEDGEISGNFASGFTTNFILATVGNVANVKLGPNTIQAGMTEASDYGGITTLTGENFGFSGTTPVTQQTALTAADATAVNTGDAATDDVIDNIRTRLGEVETKLQAYGWLA